jgi:hypothetical protein
MCIDYQSVRGQLPIAHEARLRIKTNRAEELHWGYLHRDAAYARSVGSCSTASRTNAN